MGLYKDPPSLNSLAPLPQNDRHSLTHARPSISSARSAGGALCFVDAQESEQTSSQRKRGLFLCQLPGKSAFYCHYRDPCKRACVCVNNCLKREGDRPQLNSELFLCICYKCKLIDIPLCSILFDADFLTQLPFTITDLKDRAEYSCGLLRVKKAGADASQ